MKYLFIITLMMCQMANYSLAQDEIKSMDDFNTDKEKYSYLFGYLTAINQIENQTEIDPDILLKAFEEAYNGKENIYTRDEIFEITRAYKRATYLVQFEENDKKCKAFLEDNTTKQGIITTKSGLQYKIIEESEGKPVEFKENSFDKYTFTVNYQLNKINGEELFNSFKRDNYVELSASQIFDGLEEGLKLMPVGSIYQFYIPTELAFNDDPPKGQGIDPKDALVIKLELIKAEVK